MRFLLYANEWDVEGIIANRPVARPGENRNPERTGLGIVRRLLEAYGRDLGQFAGFMCDHLGAPPANRDLAELTVSDFRAFLARRRNEGVESRTLARQLSSLRSFYRHAEKKGLFRNPALSALRS